MIPVSVVILARNEAHIIGDTLLSVKSLTDDILIVDTGSVDDTMSISSSAGARVAESEWLGFGATKNMGIDAAKYDWILSIDADEQPDEQLIKSLNAVDLDNVNIAYNISFKTYFGKKQIRFGEWGKDSHVRFFNRTKIKWNNAAVHEQLIIPAEVNIQTLKGFIHHYTVKDVADYETKTKNYALLSAERYLRQGKKAGWIKRYIAPSFSFIQNYIFKFGFVDGSEGYTIAKMTSLYTRMKYAKLHEMNKEK